MCRCDFGSDRHGAKTVVFASFRQCLHIGRREVFWSPAEMCGCRSEKKWPSCSVLDRVPKVSQGAVNADEMGF